MHTYSNNDLDNFHIQQQAEDAFQQGIISKESLHAVKQQHPYSFYRAGGFIRIALSLLCVVCIVFAALLLFLVMSGSDDFSMLSFILLIACYGLLEFMVKTKKYYNAGIDNTLQVFTIVFFAGLFFNGDYSYQDIVITIAVLVAAVWLCVRFTDAFMALVAFAAFLVLVFLFWKHSGNMLYMPFILMLASASIYLFQCWLQTKQRLHFYAKSFSILSIATLITFYAAINVYVVVEVGKPFLTGIDAGNRYIIIYWILGIIIPFAYAIYGFVKKKAVFLRVGFVTLCATIVTLYYYTYLLTTEAALIVAGCILAALGYTCMKYLKNGRLGFTARSHTSLNNQLITAETLISMQLGGQRTPQQNIEFGGGSTGGAGASGNW
jgi:hypothetical protein